MKKTLSQKDKSVSKAVRMADEAVRLTRANQLGPRKKATRKKANKAVRKAVNQGPFMDRKKTLQVPGTKGLHAAAIAWAKGLENPFNGSPQRCPFNFNPVPSYLSMVATTTAARFGADAAAAGSCVQLTFFPGHMALNSTGAIDQAGLVASAVYDFDEVAYHCPFLITNGNATGTVGPCNYVDGLNVARSATAYVVTTGLAVNSATNSFATNSTQIGWNSGLPFSGAVASEGHLRHKLLSMGVKIINTTPELSRGGDFISVQPATVMDLISPISGNSIHPSFKVWGPEGCEVTWIPRLRDLAYWHPTADTILTSGVSTAPVTSALATGAGMVVWLNNATATAQTYDIEVVCHWEISGWSVQSLSDQGKSSHLSDSVVKGALAAQTNNAPTAKGFAGTLEAAAGGVVHAVEAGANLVGKVAALAPRVAAAAALK